MTTMTKTPTTLPPVLLPLERQAGDLAGAYANLTELVAQCEQAKAEVERQFIADIRRLSAVVSRRRDNLLAEVAARQEDFASPKSVTLHGWKLGWRKQPGTLFVDDEPTVIEKLRRLLKAAAAPLIRVKESLDKAALREQPADVLAKCGVTLCADTDEPFVSRVGGDVEKLVEDILKRADAKN
jgi:phage host-nuclease inhibitor protein Gam